MDGANVRRRAAGLLRDDAVGRKESVAVNPAGADSGGVAVARQALLAFEKRTRALLPQVIFAVIIRPEDAEQKRIHGHESEQNVAECPQPHRPVAAQP